MRGTGFEAFGAGRGPGWRFARASDLKDAETVVDEELERLMDQQPRDAFGALDATLKMAFFTCAALVPGLFFSLAVPSADEGAFLLGLIAASAAAAAGVWAIGRRSEKSFVDAAEKIGLSRERAAKFYAAFHAGRTQSGA